MSKEYIQAFGLIKRTCELYMESTRFLKGSDIIANQIKEALNIIQNRLEAIDNSEPSDGLKTLEKLDKIISPLLEPVLAEYEDDLSDKITSNYFALKQYILKAQEPKHYLKWEDLVFTVDWKIMTVKMGDTVYKMLYRYCYANEEVQLLSEDKKLLCLRLIGRYKANVQFFNDLHLERVE